MESYLQLITLLVGDVPRSEAFYTEHLGFEVVPAFTAPDRSFVWLRSVRQGTSLALQDASKRGAKPTQADIPEQSGGLMLGFAVDDADKAYRAFQEGGVTLRTGVVDMGKGRTFGAKDPDGNYIQVFDVYPKFREVQRRIGLE